MQSQSKVTLSRLLLTTFAAMALMVSRSTISRAEESPPDTCPGIMLCLAPSSPSAAYEQTIVQALDAQSLTLSLVADIPGPIPRPQATALLSIADDFQAVEALIVIARSLSLRADMPGPLPQPSRPVLLAQAALARQLALGLTTNLQNRINRMDIPGPLPEPAAEKLMQLKTNVTQLITAIADMPGPLPMPGD